MSTHHHGINHPPATDKIAVIMVPFPAQGHLNQLLQLSCLLCKHDFPVYYISSPIHSRQARARINGLNPLDVAKIRFNDIPIPPFESLPPDSKIRFPSQLQPAWNAALRQRLPVASFMREISASVKRVVVIHDSLMASVVQDVASIPNAESYSYNCISAFADASMYLEFVGMPLPDEIPKDVPSFESSCFTQEMIDLVDMQLEPLKIKAGGLYNTCREIEAPYLDILADSEILRNKKLWAIGPILLQCLWKEGDKSTDNTKKCLEWLDKQEPKSVIYVSFGTTTSFSNEEIRELAMGLEQSKCKFLWVVKEADKGNIFDSGKVRQAELPQGFEERVQGVGFVERDWAPQPEILGHRSVGGFLSHCGWNSCIESLMMGVPIAALPIHSDQPRNSYLVTRILKVGILAREWDDGHTREEMVKASAIENAVKTLMSSEEGRKTRTRAEELANAIRRPTEEGGVSRLQLNSFITHITR